MSVATETTRTQTKTVAKALNAALHDAMAEDESVVLLGEDIGTLGGVFRITDGLLDEFGRQRVIDTPLAESGIVGTAIGLAYRGYRPVVEIQFDGFVYPAFDQIVSQLAKLHSRSGGTVRMPITVRIPWAGGIGAAEHHSESPEAYFMHTAGLRVAVVSNGQDAYDVLRQAIACDDPVIFLEPKRLYQTKSPAVTGRRIEELEPFDSARVLRQGTDVTVLTYGGLVPTALDAAAAGEDDGMSLEVIDLRSLSPIDYATIDASVMRTGRLVVVHEASREAGPAAEVITTVVEHCFEYLQAAPRRVTGHDIPYPPAKLEGHHLPDLDRILYAVDQVMLPLGEQTGETR